ncbi:hypothetical protein PDESU_05802 [Pontiella desulfatans]|uniref:Uncharacterized protein n=1 Tax=Pontiella desulfatans TaxID=2750659 RepID=A0A6C2UDB5_PONDE|nr:hypothetical protein [Pontiella desulfatans]VGO17206.1 hypothetical protein PDESU_05802 [Pontiella desulfatans]
MQTPSDWIKVRRLLWDDDEYILLADTVYEKKPMRLARKITVQPKKQFCIGNSFSAGSTRRRDNIVRLHTWVIEHDEKMPITHQRDMWRLDDTPHTLRVFSGGKSIHTYIRLEEDVDSITWERIARDLLLIFPKADPKPLTNRISFSRLPFGVRSDGDQRTDQKVEATNSRIPLKTLTDWIARQDVIKERQCHRDREESSFRGTTRGENEGACQAWHELKTTSPEIARLYKKLIAHRVSAEQGRRNTELVALVTFAFDSVCEEVAMSFAELFYRLHANVFEDTLERHMKDARAHYNGMMRSYPERLSERERSFYDNRDEREQTFFRICRGLSLCECSEGRTLGIPQTYTGYRMGLDTQQVARLIEKFISAGILRRIQPGTRHHTDRNGNLIRGKAAVYEWILSHPAPSEP